MYQIKVEKQCINRWYTANSYFDALELFNELSKILPFVQVWKGDKLISEYKI